MKLKIYPSKKFVPLNFDIGDLVRIKKRTNDLCLTALYNRNLDQERRINGKTICKVLGKEKHQNKTVLCLTPEKKYLKRFIDVYESNVYFFEISKPNFLLNKIRNFPPYLIKLKANSLVVACQKFFELGEKFKFDKLFLCHGTVKRKDKRIIHAWVEYRNMIFDFSGGYKLIANKDEYYKFFKVQRVVKYNKTKVLKYLKYTGHYGTWSKTFSVFN